jgi:hypothetical protein
MSTQNKFSLNLFIGFTKKNFDKLRYEWRDWLNKKKLIHDVKLQLLQILNKSIPSLSRIMFLVKCNNNKILYTGGGLGKDVIGPLSKNGLLDKQGKLHIDVLKVPHHGIDRNVTMKFFNPMSGDNYVSSANRRDHNPSLATLGWIIESKHRGKNRKKNSPNK